MEKKQTLEVKNYLMSKTKRVKFKHYPNIKHQVLSLLQDQGFERPTLVQAQSLPITLEKNLRDLCTIIYAYNGAGKTLTYLIPILNSLEMIPYTGAVTKKIKQNNRQKPIRRPQAIIIVPIQALMSQIYDYLTSYAAYYQVTYKWPLKIGRVYSALHEQGHILVGLPAKLKTVLSDNLVYDFSELKWVVFDQCDMIKTNTQKDFEQILKLFSTNLAYNSSYPNFLITSATGDKEQFRKVIQQKLYNHNIIELDSKQKNLGLEGVTHYYSSAANKDQVIFKILQILSGQQIKLQVIIFFNQISELENFYALLSNQRKRFLINDPTADKKGKNNLPVSYIHGRVGKCIGHHKCPEDCSMGKSKRVELLRNENIQVLLGTETIGRGIDIRTVSLVINYSQPTKNKEQLSPITYIHRVGRTGRYTDEGIALTFISNKKFIKLTQDDQKIIFKQMVSENKIVQQALTCFKRNNIGKDSGNLRWDAE